jgi:hypothetical protein
VSSPTPGPWTVIVWDQTVFIYGGPDNDDIADFSFADQHTVSISKDEAIANATLCAAAHDLLAASQAAISAWHSVVLSDDIAPRSLFGPIVALHAAIIKATTVTP